MKIYLTFDIDIWFILSHAIEVVNNCATHQSIIIWDTVVDGWWPSHSNWPIMAFGCFVSKTSQLLRYFLIDCFSTQWQKYSSNVYHYILKKYIWKVLLLHKKHREILIQGTLTDEGSSQRVISELAQTGSLVGDVTFVWQDTLLSLERFALTHQVLTDKLM